jgi:diguanylate cyclase (GGDEF)-like protein
LTGATGITMVDTVLPCASFDGIPSRIEHIREQLTHMTIEPERLQLKPVTLSIGVAIFPDHGDSAEEVIRSADAALYLAKKGGRDRVVYHAGEPQRVGV